MEIVRIDINRELLQMLVDSSALTIDDFTIIKVEVPDFNYSDFPEWKQQKDKSNSEYKRLKELEYQIRKK